MELLDHDGPSVIVKVRLRLLRIAAVAVGKWAQQVAAWVKFKLGAQMEVQVGGVVATTLRKLKKID
eukprot:274178-Amphidinium_carterae.1